MKYLFVFCLILVGLVTIAQDTVVVQDLRSGWLGYTREGDLFPAFRPGVYEVVSFRVPKTFASPYMLKVSSAEEVDIWLNDQMLVHDFDTTLILRPEDLSEADLISIYSRDGMPVSLEAKIISIFPESKTDMVFPEERFFRRETESYLILSAIVVILMGIFKRFFGVTFTQSFRNPLTHKIRSISVEGNYMSFGSIDNLYSVFFLGIAMSLMFRYFDYELIYMPRGFFFNDIAAWLIGSFLIAFLVVIKFILARLLGGLFQIRDLPNIQIQDFTHFFTLIATSGLLLTFIDFSIFDSKSLFIGQFLHYLLVIAVIFFQFWLYFKLVRFYSVRKMMIISYLCTTEFLPGFLTLYWLMKV